MYDRGKGVIIFHRLKQVFERFIREDRPLFYGFTGILVKKIKK